MFSDLLNSPKWAKSDWGAHRLHSRRSLRGHFSSHFHTAVRKRWLIHPAIFLGLTLCLLFPYPSCKAQDSKAEQYRAKASFLAAFPHFVEWPTNAFPSAYAPILLCIYGQYSFGISLAEATSRSSIHGRHIEIRLVRKDQELYPCNILFVSQSEAKEYGRILKIAREANVLTVGETPDFLASGGTISFFMQDEKLRFDVNLDAANAAHLRISSNMLALARHVAISEKATR